VDQARIRAIMWAMCILAVGAGCTFSWQGPQTGGGPAVPGETSLPAPSPSAAASDRTPQTTIVSPIDVEQSLRLLEDHASLLRGLRPSTVIPLELLSPDDMQAMAFEVCLAQRTQEALRPETLAMLGLGGGELDADADYATFAAEWAAGVTSLYDQKSRSIALNDPPMFDSSLRLDYLASYVSALRAEVLDVSPSTTCCPIGCAAADDTDLAMAAMLIGDTRLAQEQWVRIYGDKEDAARMGGLLAAADETSLFTAPQFLRDTYDLVLSSGRAFIQELYLGGGWAAVDEAYADPPVSTEQILHPERYPKDAPLSLRAPDLGGTLGPSWELRQMTALGEWRTRQVLGVYLPPDESAEAAADWGGDVLMTYHNALLDEDILLLITRWDNLRQAQDFALAFRKYGEARFGERRPTPQADTWTWEGGYTLLERASDQTLWILGSDKTTVETARFGVSFPVPVR
jgi:hypothetical protein